MSNQVKFIGIIGLIGRQRIGKKFNNYTNLLWHIFCGKSIEVEVLYFIMKIKMNTKVLREFCLLMNACNDYLNLHVI